MGKFSFFFIITLMLSSVSIAQKKRTNQIAIKIDNDRFTPDATDKYYTSGIKINWQKVITDSLFLQKIFKEHSPFKSLFEVSIFHKIYTPKNIASLLEQVNDRPYASTLTICGGYNLFFANKSLLQGKIELGVTGKMSGGEAFQKWWHKQSKITLPVGWENQISNSPIIDINLSYSKQWFDAKWLDFITESHLQFGTLRTSTRHGGVMRFGFIDKFHQSVYTNSRLHMVDNYRRFEIYFYYGASIEYVQYNGLIQGNWLGKKSPHTLKITPWVYYVQYGVGMGNHHLDFNFSYQNLSKEMDMGLTHKYASILLNVRF